MVREKERKEKEGEGTEIALNQDFVRVAAAFRAPLLDAPVGHAPRHEGLDLPVQRSFLEAIMLQGPGADGALCFPQPGRHERFTHSVGGLARLVRPRRCLVGTVAGLVLPGDP
jgi:hypothetical protein